MKKIKGNIVGDGCYLRKDETARPSRISNEQAVDGCGLSRQIAQLKDDVPRGEQGGFMK